jgi:hypothetical protein
MLNAIKKFPVDYASIREGMGLLTPGVQKAVPLDRMKEFLTHSAQSLTEM